FYTLGYDLTAYARYQYGADIWDKVTDRYTRHIYLVPPFSRSLKHYTGIGTKGLFNQTFSFLKHEWEIQDSLYLTKGAKHKPVYLSPETKQYTSYQYPQIVNDSIIIAVKSSLQDIHSLVIIKKRSPTVYFKQMRHPVIGLRMEVYGGQFGGIQIE
ncbi:hypothetical protein EZS27_041720, partial [termite gut metagenome]